MANSDMGNKHLGFVLGDKLPTYYDVSIAIFSVSTQRKGQQMTKTIHSYYLALVDAWSKSFGNGVEVILQKSLKS